MSTGLVIVELVGGKLSAVSLELLALARSLVGGGTVAVMAPGADALTAQVLITRGADKIYVSGGSNAANYESDAWVGYAERLARELNPTVILAAHNSTGADLAPRLAFRLGDLGGACATGCIAVEDRNGTLHFTRPCYGGNARETVSFKTGLAVATVM